ncbi:hypothetical protein ABPG74_006198 [Tetrahymena malaccensis]
MDDQNQYSLNENTQDYSNSNQNSHLKSFEEEYEEHGKCFSDCEYFCLDAQRLKSRQLKNMISNLLVDSDHFQYLKLKDQEEAMLSIIQFDYQFQDDVQSFLDIMNIIIAENPDIFTDYINFEIIEDNQSKINCSLYIIKPLDIQAIQCLNIIQAHQITQFIRQILQIFSKYEILKKFINNLMLIQFIQLNPNGQLRFDYLYFFQYQFNMKFQMKYNRIKEVQTENKINNQQENQQIINLRQQEIDVLKQEYFKKKSQNSINIILYKCSLNYIIKTFKCLIYDFKQLSCKQQLYISEIEQYQSYFQNNFIQISNQEQYSTQDFTIDFSTLDINTIKQENNQSDLSNTVPDQENHQPRSDFDLSDQAYIQQEPTPQKILNFQIQIKKLIYNQCVENIDQIVKNYNKCQNYQDYHNNIKEEEEEEVEKQNKQNAFKFNINQKVYISLIKIAKKIFYKHILKTSQMYYANSPFYYENILTLKKELQEEGEVFINIKKFQSSEDRKIYSSLTSEEQMKILGNILNIQLSLKDYITKSIIENPIRFTECVRHTECFDYSTLSYLQKLRKCPECFQPIRDFYEDKYLKFIIKFLSRQNKQQNNNTLLMQQKRDYYFPYFIQSVNCYSNNGIFVPIIEYINLQGIPQNDDSNLYPITNFIDLEYFYQIIKYQTKERLQQMLYQNQFNYQIQDNLTAQPILSIVDFINFGRQFQFRLNKVFNQNSFIEYPVRNSNYSCNHVDCFDISDLFLINQVQNFQDNNLQCPICKNSFKVEDLVYDKEYKNIINFVELSLLQKNEMSKAEYLFQKKHYSATIDFGQDIVTYLDDQMQQQNIRFQSLQLNFQEYKKIEQYTSINQDQNQIFDYDYDQENLRQLMECQEQLQEEDKYIINNSQVFDQLMSDEIQTNPYSQYQFTYNNDNTIDYFKQYE